MEDLIKLGVLVSTYEFPESVDNVAEVAYNHH